MAAGCEELFTDTAPGSRSDRPGLAEAISYARPGDTLVVWRLDRLRRPLLHLIQTVTELQGRGIGLKSLQEQPDISTSGGKLVFHVFGALAELSETSSGSGRQLGLRRPGLEDGNVAGQQH
jgi:DNA invertase Pin-like site-specific DNA recombinase